MDGLRTQVEMALDRSLSDNMHDWASVKAGCVRRCPAISIAAPNAAR